MARTALRTGTLRIERVFVRELAGISRGWAEVFVRYLEKAGRTVTTDAATGVPSKDVDHVLGDVLPQIAPKVRRAHEKMSRSLVENYDKAMSVVLPIGFAKLPSNVQAEAEKARDNSIAYVEKACRAYAQDVREVFADPANTIGKRWEDLKAQLLERGNVSESRAELIARDQTLKLNGAINQARQQSLGLDSYVWDTSGDERVREEHAALDGQTFRWDSPPEPGHPGEDFQCRCIALPIIAELEGL